MAFFSSFSIFSQKNQFSDYRVTYRETRKMQLAGRTQELANPTKTLTLNFLNPKTKPRLIVEIPSNSKSFSVVIFFRRRSATDRGRRRILVYIDDFPAVLFTDEFAPLRRRRRSRGSDKLCSRPASGGCRREKTSAPSKI